jgi:hypothetical protein
VLKANCPSFSPLLSQQDHLWSPSEVIILTSQQCRSNPKFYLSRLKEETPPLPQLHILSCHRGWPHGLSSSGRPSTKFKVSDIWPCFLIMHIFWLNGTNFVSQSMPHIYNALRVSKKGPLQESAKHSSLNTYCLFLSLSDSQATSIFSVLDYWCTHLGHESLQCDCVPVRQHWLIGCFAWTDLSG